MRTDGQAEQSEEAIDKSAEAVPNVLAEDDKPAEEKIFPEITYIPTGKPIPDGYHGGWHSSWEDIPRTKAARFDPVRSVENAQSKGQRKAHRLGSRENGRWCQCIIKLCHKGSEEKEKYRSNCEEASGNPSPSGEPGTAQCWAVIPTDRPKFCVPAMPKVAQAKAELHRPELREMIKQKIQELEFKVALELFSAVARLVPIRAP